MEKELEYKIFYLNDYDDIFYMQKEIKDYVKLLKLNYPNAIITKEFYKGKNILVRVTLVYNIEKNHQTIKTKEKEIDDWYIRGRGER